MPDEFLLEPDQIEAPDRPERRTPPKYVPLGGTLHPLEPVPITARKVPAPVVVYEPCACGRLVLIGCTDQGAVLAVDPVIPCYVVFWAPHAARPRLVASRAYPVHRCPADPRQGG